MKHADHRKLVNRVKRIEGQVRGISNMIEDQKYCIDILTQIKASRSALKSLELEILENHVSHCLMNASLSNNEHEVEEKIKEVMDLLRRSSKS